MILLLYLIYSLYSAVSGFKDAVLWSRKGADAFKWDEHFIFIIERVAIWGSLFLTAHLVFYFSLDLWAFHTCLVCTLFSFPFFHNGSYHEARNAIDGSYRKGWCSNSTTSTAPVNFSFPVRFVLFLLSTIYLIAYEIAIH